jgi:FtsP/CotA-like multicopper oxidase with cupredoxin domain
MDTLSRRRFLGLSAGAAGTLVLSACGGGDSEELVGPRDPAVAARERQRRRAGQPAFALEVVAAPIAVDLAGQAVRTWGYGDQLGSPAVRARVGDLIEARLVNKLPEPTTIHWHGIALRNDMDGVHDLTQAPVAPGTTFTYRFTLPDPGTFFFHPHTGLQLDRGLYAPLVVEDPRDPLTVDADEVIVLDDWLDGIEGSPEAALTRLRRSGEGATDSGGHDGHGGGAEDPTVRTERSPTTRQTNSALLGGHAGDVVHPLHLLNGRPPRDRPTMLAAAGARVRLRIINAGSDTAYRFAVGGHRLTITHADGFSVQPVEVDAVLLGMGERYDVVVVARSGAWPVVALAEGKGGAAEAVLRTADAAGSAPPSIGVRPSELDGRLLEYRDLRPVNAVRLESRRPARTFRLDLTGTHEGYEWGIGGKAFPESESLEVQEGQRIRCEIRNRSSMWHPMHLHGHTFALESGARKDTVNVLPDERRTVEFDAANPGQWMFHCHNTYHQEAGMAAVVSYVR